MDLFMKAFRRNADGSWTCIQPAELHSPHGRIQVTPGTTFRRGTIFMNADIAKLLDDHAEAQRRIGGAGCPD